MKKLYKIFASAAAAAVIFSCAKEENQPNDTISTSDETSQEQPVEEQPGITGEGLLLSFGATTEAAKTSIDDAAGTVTLESGDEVLVYSAGNTGKYVYDGTQFAPATETDAVAISADVEVFYPFASFDLETDHIAYTMPAAVTSLKDLGDKNPLAGKVAGEEGNYSVLLKAVGAILKVEITGERKLSAVSLENAGTARMPLGEGTVFSFSWDGTDPALSPDAAGTGALMSISDLSVQLSATPETFWFIVPAGIAYPDIKVTADLTTADAAGLTNFAVERGDFTATRNKIYSLSFFAGLFSGGDGTSENPYKIATARDWRNISKYAAEGYGYNPETKLDGSRFLAASYIQTADIDFKGADLSNYMIASDSAPFTGTYDGGNKTLSGFTITGSPSGNEGVAPFKALNGATLENISISGASVTGGKFTAGLVGYSKGSDLAISNCSISNSTISSNADYGAGGLIGGIYGGAVTNCSGTDLTIEATNSSKKQYYGGLINYINGSVNVNGCSLNGTTTVNGTAVYFGGIVGQVNNDNAKIINCENKSTISGVGNFAGGIAGLKSKGSIESCTNTGSVGGAQYVGGIAGRNEAGNILDCTNEGAVASTGIAGGIAGQVTGGTIKDCTNESSATFSVSGATVGGIAGSITGGSITASEGKYTENKADIDLGVVEGNNVVGGIAGEVKSDISNVKNTGKVIGYYHIGGIAGYVLQGGAVGNAVSSGNVSGYQNVGGISGTCGHNANAAITKKMSLKNCHVDGASVTASANQGRVGGLVGLARAGSWIEGCTAFRGTVSGHQDVGGAIGHFWYASTNTDKSNRIYVGANLVAMDVVGLDSIQSTSRIGGFVGYFQNSADNYSFMYQNGVVGGSITAEGCQYVGSFVGYASASSNKGRIWDSYSLVEDDDFHVTTTNANIGGFAGGYGNANVNSTRNAHVNAQNTSGATSGITKTTVADIRTVQLVHNQGYETPSCNVDGSAYTTTTWSNPDDVNYPVPTILVTNGHYK